MVVDNEEEISYAGKDPRLFYDSCCSNEMLIVKDADELHFYKKSDHIIGTADESGGTLKVAGTGMLYGEENVYHCPDSRKNLIGPGRLENWGFGFHTEPGMPPVLENKDNGTRFIGYKSNRMPYFNFDEILNYIKKKNGYDLFEESSAVVAAEAEQTFRLWHERMGHMDFNKVADMYRKT